MKVPTFVIDYPEAHAAMRVIGDAFSVKPAGTLPALGARPASIDGDGHELPSEPFVVVNGSGNYHHETVPIVQGFLRKRPDERFAYVQIDAHPDKDDRFRWKVDCASFVGRVLREPQIDTVWLLGINPVCLIDDDRPDRIVTRRASYYGDHYFTKLREYVTSNEVVEQFFQYNPTHAETARANPSVAGVEEKEDVPPIRNHVLDAEDPQPCLAVRWKTLDALDMARDLPDLPVYLTIDLDVSREKPVTDWKERDRSAPLNRWGVPDNQGVMAWDDVLGLVRSLGEARRVVAADFCGLTKRVDGLREDAREMSLAAMVEVYDVVTAAMARGA